MFNKFFQNTRKPEGTLGRMMLRGMNSGHKKMADWGFSHLKIDDNLHILDIGCGGGANIAAMLKISPNSIVDGIDYSSESVAFSQKTNSKHLGKRCTIVQGDVSSLPYPDNSLDLVTAFETIYFWPSLTTAFAEIKRAVKSEGIFFICAEADNPDDTTWTDRIDGMTVYRGEDLKNQLLEIGFKNVELNRNENGWICLKAIV